MGVKQHLHRVLLELVGVGAAPGLGWVLVGFHGSLLGGLLTNYPRTVMKYFADLVLCRSVQACEGGDTRTGHRPTGSGPGSSRPSCRSAPGSPGTCTARPRSAPRPSAAACDLSSASCSSSPSLSARCAACTCPRRPPLGRWGCRSPHPGTGAAAPPGLAPAAQLRWLRSSLPAAGGHSRWLRPAPGPRDHRRRQPARFP